MNTRVHIFILGFCLQISCSNTETKEINLQENVPDQSDSSEDTSASIDTAETIPTYDCGDTEIYEPVPIGKWKICRAKSLSINQPTISAEAITLLTDNLVHIETLLDPEIIEYLQTVRIWLEEDISAFPGAVYHPSETWLSNNGYPPYWAEGIQIGNASNYLSWTSIQPAMVLHELSHAWHHQILGYNQIEISEAYDAAVLSGVYDSVEYAGGGTQSAYALTNKQEYFAELTEAYFWENDFYPFNRSQLEIFDPQGYQAIENAWVYPE